MPRSTLTSLCIGTAAMVIAMAAVLSMPSPSVGRNATAAAILAFALALSSWQLTMTTITSRPAVATMMAHIFFVFFLIIPALAQLVTGTYALYMSVYKPYVATHSAMLVLLFLVCFVAGGALGPKGLDRATRAIMACERRRRGAVVLAFVVFAAAVAIAAILGFGLDTLMANRTSVSGHMEQEQTKATAGLFLDFPRAISFCAMLALLYLFGRRDSRRRTWALLFGVLIVPLFLVVNYPLALPRYWLFGMLLVVALLYLDLRRIRNRLLIIVGIGGGAYTIFPFIRTLTTVERIDSGLDMKPAADAVVSMDFAHYEMLMNMVIAVERFGHTFGHQLLSALLFFVPRSWWEGKAVPSGYYTAEKLGYHFTNLSAPNMGELYLDFSYPGVVIGGLAIGYVYRKVDTLYAASLAFGGISLHRIQAAMLAGFTIILMRGALLAIIALIATSFAAIWMLMVAPRAGRLLAGTSAKRRRKSARAAT